MNCTLDAGYSDHDHILHACKRLPNFPAFSRGSFGTTFAANECMKLHHWLLALTLATSASACVNDAMDPPNDLSEDALTVATRLDQVTASEIATEYALVIRDELNACSTAHPSMTTIDAGNVSAFTRIDSTFYMTLGAYIRERLRTTPSLTLVQLRNGAQATAIAELEPLAPAGSFLDYEREFSRHESVLVRYSDAYTAAAEVKAIRAASPTAVDLNALREAWRATVRQRPGFDSRFLRPVVFAGEPTVGDLRKVFQIRGGVASWGMRALERFANTPEGPNGAPAFRPIGEMLRSPSIKKRYFFADAGRGFGSNTLVVVDANNHAYGMFMGYSE
jgi:hypothetical protein